ncbi:hypothetical protein TWF718_003967 [Orbilia javanica]|uniref:Uncharacterized protein n=1 Tax=Orbilia javanica TaxID=47235 RepID=A0AAN8NZ14_9PEZI
MSRTRNSYGNRPTFNPPSRWFFLHYLQSLVCMVCLPFFAIAASYRISYSRNSPKFIALPGGWGYIVTLACISFYIFFSVVSCLILCSNLTITPTGGFGFDVFILVLWVASLTGTIAAQVGFSKALASEANRRNSTPTTPRLGIWMTFSCLVICFIISIHTTYLSYLQFKEYRQKLHQRRSIEATVSLVSSPSPPSTSSSSSPSTTIPQTTNPSPPQTAARPVSVASSLWSRIRPASSSSIPTRHRDEETGRLGEEEPKPENAQETTGLTREQIIAERVEAARAPPTYWYATSGQPRRDAQAHDPEAGDETLPLYRPECPTTSSSRFSMKLV